MGSEKIDHKAATGVGGDGQKGIKGATGAGNALQLRLAEARLAARSAVDADNAHAQDSH